MLQRGSRQWHLGSAVWALSQLPCRGWGSLHASFPLKEGVSMQVDGYSKGMSEGSSWERVWIREPEDGGVSSTSGPQIPPK